MFKLWKAASYWHHQWPLKTQGRKEKSCHPLPYRFIPAAGDSPAASGSCLGGKEMLLCFVPLSLCPHKGAVEQRLCDPGCAGPREFPFTEGKVTFSSVSPGSWRWWFGGFWWVFFKLTVKIGHCRKQLLCQLLRNYFWIPKLSEFSKSSWEKSWCCSMWSTLSLSELSSYQHLW